jgi:hypothetical protein
MVVPESLVRRNLDGREARAIKVALITVRGNTRDTRDIKIDHTVFTFIFTFTMDTLNPERVRKKKDG